MNAQAGAVFYVDVKGPSEQAKRLWGVVGSADQLPAIRYLSDITWALWNRHMNKERGNIKNIRYIFAVNLANAETDTIIDKAFQKYLLDDGKTKGPDTEPKAWPGTTFKTTTVWGAALLGSVNGVAAGKLTHMAITCYVCGVHANISKQAHFLIQHQTQLGNKWIPRVTVWESTSSFAITTAILFWVEDVPRPTNSGSGDDSRHSYEPNYEPEVKEEPVFDVKVAHPASISASHVVRRNLTGLDIINEHITVEVPRSDLETIVFDADVIEDLSKEPGVEWEPQQVVKIITARLARHGADPVFIALSERLQQLRDRYESGQLESLEFLRSLLAVARDTLQAERE
ncbi:MAG: hypothetical protein EOO38_28735, partial [Cytophagaceae bacterium]